MTKDGKKPLSTKPQSRNITDDTFFENRLNIPKAIQKELDSKNLVGHWINRKMYADNDGYHKSHWTPYKLDKQSYDTMGSEGLKYGQSPDGFLRRGDLVLAAKPTDQVAQHKAFLKRRADLYTKAVKTKAAEGLRETLTRGGFAASAVKDETEVDSEDV